MEITNTQATVPLLDEAVAVKALAALAQVQRLRAFRARGRNLIYRADIAHMNALLAYLTEHCCEGQACGVQAAAVCG